MTCHIAAEGTGHIAAEGTDFGRELQMKNSVSKLTWSHQDLRWP